MKFLTAYLLKERIFLLLFTFVSLVELLVGFLYVPYHDELTLGQSKRIMISSSSTLTTFSDIHERRSFVFDYLKLFFRWNAIPPPNVFLFQKNDTSFFSIPRILKKLKPKSTPFRCRLDYLKSQPYRYTSLKQYTFLFALNLYNNDAILSDLLASLIYVFSLLDPSKIHVSIFENGSLDFSKPLLQATSTILTSLSINHTICLNDTERPYWVHRIKYMSELRNQPLQVLWKSPLELCKQTTQKYIYRFDSKGRRVQQNFGFSNKAQLPKFDRIVFSNDILFCPDQFLELLYQSFFQNSHITCGMDYDGDKHPLFYDIWVARDVFGEPFQKLPNDKIFESNHFSYQRKKNFLPFQVHCCWNGAAVLHPAAFYEHNVTFRQGNESEGECPGSECTTLCRDFLKHNFSRVLMVPKFKIAYKHEIFAMLNHLDSPFQTLMRISSKDDEQITFLRPPSKQYCRPLIKNATDDPDAPPFYEDLSTIISS